MNLRTTKSYLIVIGSIPCLVKISHYFYDPFPTLYIVCNNNDIRTRLVGNGSVEIWIKIHLNLNLQSAQIITS